MRTLRSSRVKTKIEDTYAPENLKQDIIKEARSIGMPEGMATAIADKVTKSMTTYLKDKPVVTARDYDQKVASFIRKYHSDLAYLYENRGKII